MQDERRSDVLKRLSYIEGHVAGIRRMVEEDKYCVDILRQTHAVRKAIEKLEAIILEGHLRTCVPDGIKGNRELAALKIHPLRAFLRTLNCSGDEAHSAQPIIHCRISSLRLFARFHAADVGNRQP